MPESLKIPYLEMSKNDVVKKLQPLIEQAQFFVRHDGMICYDRNMHHDPPWIFVKSFPGHECFFCHKILFNVVFQQNKIPSGCLNCYKVVVAPRSLMELLALYAIQRKLDVPCKCGTEGDRDNTNRLYGAYFYNNSLAAGKERYLQVKEELEKREKFQLHLFGTTVTVQCGRDVPILLKRGCTEFEQSCGSSDTWDDFVDSDQIAEEKIIRNWVQHEPMYHSQSEHQIAHTINKWIHNAYKWGDDSYQLLTGGNRLFRPPVTYHELENSED